jgi:hypothetical protein
MPEFRAGEHVEFWNPETEGWRDAKRGIIFRVFPETPSIYGHAAIELESGGYCMAPLSWLHRLPVVPSCLPR